MIEAGAKLFITMTSTYFIGGCDTPLFSCCLIHSLLPSGVGRRFVIKDGGWVKFDISPASMNEGFVEIEPDQRRVRAPNLHGAVENLNGAYREVIKGKSIRVVFSCSGGLLNRSIGIITILKVNHLYVHNKIFLYLVSRFRSIM